MSSNKMSVCKHCGAEIAANAKSCPQCGGKNKKPIYKRGWFIALCVVLVIGVVSSVGGDGEEGSKTPVEPSGPATSVGSASAEQEPAVEYTAYTVDTMMDDLKGNALKATEKYNKQYIEVKGRLSNIDSSGKYIDLLPIRDEWAFIGVQCYIKSDEQRQQVTDMSVGDEVTLKGKVISVGEILGYSLDIDEIVK